MIDVSIIVPVHNEADTLTPFLASLLTQETTPSEVIVVDAGSTDSTNRILRTHAVNGSRLRLIESGRAFPGGARNIAIRSASTSWIAMTDAGTVVSPQWLGELAAAAAGHPDADIVFGSYKPIVDTFFEKCAALSFVAPLRSVDGARGPSTASLLIRKRVWEDLGGFPEDLRACEDLRFFDRLFERGCRTVWAPKAIVEWRVPGTFGQLFRRFRTYSCHTLKAGLGAQWHRAVLMMYLAAGIAIVLGITVHWTFFLVPAAGLVARVIRSVKARPDIVAAGHPVTAATFPMVALILLCIDLGAAAGAIDYFVAPVSRKAAA